MRILWFSNTPANADEYFNKTLKGTGGWMKAMDNSLQNFVDLHIAFYHDKKVPPFKYKNSNYYTFQKKNNTILKKYLNTIKSKIIFDEDVQQYIDIINLVKPDLIHIHGTENSFGYILGKVDIPIVISIQGNINVYKHKYFSGISKSYLFSYNNLFEGLIGYKPFKISYKKFNKMVKRETYALSLSDNIIGRTHWDRRITAVLAPNAKYFHNDEILRDSFYLNKWSRNDNREKFIIFTTNGDSFYKGFETICHASFLLLKNSNIDFEWRIAGISESSLIVKVVKKLLGNKYPNRGIKLLGNLGEDELVKELLSSDLYVMPSHIENSPNNLCEAMILGLPCIATCSGGTSSLLEDNKEGVLIQDGDPWVLAGSIIDSYKNKDSFAEFGKKARNRALIRHNREKIIGDIIDNYNIIIKNSKNIINE